MKITIGMLLYLLSLDTTVYTNVSMTDTGILEEAEIWNGEFPKKNVLYLISAEELKKDPDLWYRRTVLLRGKPDRELLDKQDVYCIFVTEHLSEQQVQQKIRQNIRLIYDWYLELQKALLMRKGLAEILELTDSYLQIGSGIFTREMGLKGMSAAFCQRNTWVDQDNGVSKNMVDELITDEDFQNAEKHKDAFWFCNSEQEWFCCYNLFAEDKFDARLIASNERQTQDYGISQFVQILGETLHAVYEEFYYQKNQSSVWNDLIFMAENMLKEKGVPVNEQKVLLARYQWQMNDTYQIILFRFQEGAGAGIGMKYYQEQIQRLFRECCVIAEPTQFICIRNISRSDVTHDFSETLPYFLRDSLCKAGLSDQFTDFSQLLYYYREAEYALSAGEAVDASKWYHNFSGYAFQYLVEHCSSLLLPIQVCHPALHILGEYDSMNDTELFVTLKVYLQNRQNVTHTADLLHVHRTTLLARIDRIKMLTRLDLDDHRTCLHLMMSFEILKK